MDKVIQGLKIVTIISSLTFIMTTYFGIVGFSMPWTVIRWLNLISFILMIIIGPIYYIVSFMHDLTTETEVVEEKDKEKTVKKSKGRIVLDYIIPIIVTITIFFWAKFITPTVPLYGDHILYNPFSVIGFGNEYHGISRMSIKYLSNNKNVEMKQIGGNVAHTWYTKIFSIIMTMLSGIIYLFGAEWFGSFRTIETIITRTITKIFFGYIPKNSKLEQICKDSYILRFLQCRVTSDGILSKMAGLVRRYTLIGLDMPALDEIFENEKYNNIPFSSSSYKVDKNAYNKKLNAGQTSVIERWKWETMPFIYHWLKFSSIGYILAVIILTLKAIK